LGRYWIVHGGEGWPTPRGLHRERASTLPPVGRNLPWQRLALGAADMDAKLAAIRTYRSQLKVMERKMLSYVRSDELYTAAPLPE
jgi:LmbE family N-acetylglucosaminyl deacetylase